MLGKTLSSFAVIWLALAGAAAPAGGAEVAIRAKQWPTAFFYQYQKVPVPEKEKILARVDATLKKLNRDGYGLIAKGGVIDKLGSDRRIYDHLTILDDSGLIIVARNVPNLYYQYPGPGPINPNIYLIVKNVRLNVPESYIRYGFVVEGDFQAYVHKFVTAIQESLEKADLKEEPGPLQK